MIEIPLPTFWSALGVILTALIVMIGWLIKNENRMSSFMLRKEHEDICIKSSNSIKHRLDELNSAALMAVGQAVKRSEEDRTESRLQAVTMYAKFDTIAKQVSEIQVIVAVLGERVGMDVLRGRQQLQKENL